MQRAGIFVGVAVTYLVASGCYHPEVRDCTVACSVPTDCTGGQICRADGWCAMPGSRNCSKGGDGDDNMAADASATPDTPSGPSLCEQGCTNGSCVDGVCVLDCSAPYACPNDVTCPANLPCRVVCGERACGHKVICGLATSCEVKCNGDYACADEIQCNANRCDVDCLGIGSCKRRTKCSNACSCDVSCIGAGSCLEASDCPASACRLGNGCTSQISGCDSC